MAVSVSCSSDTDEYNPFDHQAFSEFDASSITFKKKNDNIETVEKWSDIVCNSEKKVTAYTYTRSTTGYITENETSKCRIDYFLKYDGSSAIRVRTETEYYKKENNIEEKYRESSVEEITMNSDGYINAIRTTADRFEDGSSTPDIISSYRTFTYDGDFCTGSAYSDGNLSITYTYSWEAYQLKKISILKENSKNSTAEHSTYEYTFDTSALSEYSGCETLPYVQSGFPPIFASMNYFGKFTPFILTEEVQSGSTDYGDGLGSRPKTEIRIKYDYNANDSNELKYTGTSRIYDTYSLTFSK